MLLRCAHLACMFDRVISRCGAQHLCQGGSCPQQNSPMLCGCWVFGAGLCLCSGLSLLDVRHIRLADVRLMGSAVPGMFHLAVVQGQSRTRLAVHNVEMLCTASPCITQQSVLEPNVLSSAASNENAAHAPRAQIRRMYSALARAAASRAGLTQTAIPPGLPAVLRPKRHARFCTMGEQAAYMEATKHMDAFLRCSLIAVLPSGSAHCARRLIPCMCRQCRP